MILVEKTIFGFLGAFPSNLEYFMTVIVIILKPFVFFFLPKYFFVFTVDKLEWKKNKQKPIYTPYRFDRVRLLNHPKRPCSSAARRFTLYPVVFVVNESWCSGKRIKTDEPNRVVNTRIRFVESRTRSSNSIWRDAVETYGRRYIG